MDKITFCINTSQNEFEYIQLLLHSLEKNLSTLEHEILVFVDSDNQGTTEWLLTKKQIFPNLKILKNKLPICYGYARNINEMCLQASNSIVSYLQSDMVICKDYDIEVLKYLEPNMILCSTRIEPPLHGNSGEKITYDFGLEPSMFNLKRFTEYAEKQKQEKIIEYFFAPFTLYKETWNSIGGHDTMFRRSREDSDILTRLVLNNTKIIQIWNAIVYHFTCTSSRGKDWFNPNNIDAQIRTQLQQKADTIEMYRFIKKWGNFNHSTTKPNYYEISAKIKGELTQSQLLIIEPFFNKVYIENVDLIPIIQEHYIAEHDIANNLLNITKQDWDKYSYLYNQLNIKNRIKPYNECEDDIIIEFNANDLTNEFFNEFIVNIQHIIENTEDLGEFKYGPFKIKINQKEDKSKNKIFISNPPIKQEDLYEIY